MKKTLLLVVLLAASTLAKAHDSTLLLSKYEQFCTTQGRIIKTSSIGLGEVRSTSVEVLKTTDVRNGDSISIVRISPNYSGIKPLIANDNIYINRDELTTVINLLQYYSAEIKNQNSKQFLYSYITANDIRIGVNYKEEFFSNSWLSLAKIYQHARTPVREVLWFGRKDVDTLVKLLQTAQTVL